MPLLGRQGAAVTAIPEMPPPPFSFSSPHVWSLLKLEILGKYASALAGIVGSSQPICFVDLMAGEGYYDMGQAGSTGYFATIAGDHLNRGRAIRCIAFEANGTAFQRLEKNTRSARAFVDVRHARWETQVSELLEELTGEFVFFFVDPMGVREIPWGSLKAIVERQRAEVLINFSSVIAARLAGKALSRGPNSGENRRLVTVMDGDYWESGVEQARDDGRLGTYLADQYAGFVSRHGRHAAAWTQVRERGVSGRPKYHLIFLGRHPKAFAVMNDILNIQRERLMKQEATKKPLPLFADLDADFAETYEADRHEALVSELANSIASDAKFRGRIATISNIFDEGFGSRFAEFKQALYAPAVTRLVDDGRAAVVGEDKRHRGQLQRKVMVRIL